jgi:hypothetical protein
MESGITLIVPLPVAVVSIVIFFLAVAFVVLIVFFLVWLLAKEDIGRYRPIKRVLRLAFWIYLLMPNGLPRSPWQTQAFLMPGRDSTREKASPQHSFRSAMNSSTVSRSLRM